MPIFTIALACWFATAAASLAQNTVLAIGIANPPLAANHPIVHASFFRFTDKLTQWYDQRRTSLSSPTAAATLDQDIERFYGLQPSELKVFLQVTRSVNAEIESVDAAIRSHANFRAGFDLPPVPATIQPLFSKKNQIVASGIATLQSKISPQGWLGVQNLINVTLRNTFQKFPQQ